MEELSWEPLSPQAAVRVSRVHRFNTDTILLADFSMPKKGERCAELGAGCGVISLLWALRSDPARVFAVELQEDAAALCREIGVGAVIYCKTAAEKGWDITEQTSPSLFAQSAVDGFETVYENDDVTIFVLQ